MALDYFSLCKLTSELKQLNGSRVNKINMPDEYNVYITLYNQKTIKLILSCDPRYYRVCTSNDEKENPLKAYNFLMLLRKHIQGSKILDFNIENNDRILSITFENENDFKEIFTRKIYIELMGKYSNIFLTSNDTILGLLRPAPQNFEGKRLLMAGAKYVFPEKNSRLDFLNKEDAIKVLSQEHSNLPDLLLSSFTNFSPITAEEISIRVNNEKNSEKIYQIITNFMKENTPCTIENNGKIDCYPTNYVSLIGNRKYYSSFLQAVDITYSSKQAKEEVNSSFVSLSSIINSQIKKIQKRISDLESKEREYADIENIKLYGELLTAYIYKIKKGMKCIEVENYYDNNNLVKIPLDENLDPSKNIQKLYKKYQKGKRTLSQSEEIKNGYLLELDNLNNIKFELSTCTTLEDLKEVRQELIDIKLITVKETKQKVVLKPQLGIKYTFNGYTILVGKNSTQNNRITFTADKNDLWLHTKTLHSSHVIIKNQGVNIPEDVIKFAAEVCGYYSQGRNENKVEVDYTLKKFVKKNPSGGLGNVLYTDFVSIIINPNNHEDYMS